MECRETVETALTSRCSTPRSDLLLVSPDVRDAPRAAPLRLRDAARGAALEFREVDFAYPTQKGAHGLRQRAHLRGR